MTITEEAREGAAGLPKLSFGRPVERSVVHRRAVMEVFATDSAPMADGCYAVAVQLPRAHAYFGDHTVSPALIDPVLLLECVRQAVTVVAHRYLDVPAETSFLISDWKTRFFDAGALRTRGDAPDELVLKITVENVRSRGGRPLSARLRTELHVAGLMVGSSVVSAGYLSPDGYQGYRLLRRSTRPPMSDEMPTERGGKPVAPEFVGRRLTENVVLVDARRTGEGCEARLDVPVRHAAMYDHPLDHVPAMALLEAARQAAVHTAADGREAAGWYVVGLTARFDRFVEHDAPTLVSARERAAGRGRERVVHVEFAQHDETMCAVDVATVPAPDRLPREG